MRPSIVVHYDVIKDHLAFIKLAGTVVSSDPDADVVDGRGFNGEEGALPVSAYLFTTVPFWPQGTIFLSTVGEGKGLIIVLNNDSIIVGRDNGTATMCDDAIGIREVYVLDDNGDHDLARVCALLGSGQEPAALGSKASKDDIFLYRMPQAQISEGKACGQVGMLLKTFGNITFTIKTADFEKTGIRKDDLLEVTFTKDGKTVYQQQMTYQPSFGYVEEGAPVIFNGSSGYMDIGLNKRNFIKRCIPEILESKDIGEYKVCIERIRKA